MAPKQRGKAKKAAPKVYDYSGLEKDQRVQVESDGQWYAAFVAQISTSKNRSKAPVKVTYKDYDGYDEWVGGDRLRSKALKVVKPEKPEAEKKSLELTFGYWKIRGLGAAFRMIFEYKGVKYTDVQYDSGEKWFKEDKPKILAKNVLANLPYIECGSDTVCQTNSCLTYVGNRLRMNGMGYSARMLNEQLLCEIYDVRNTMIDLNYVHKAVCRTAEEHAEKAKQKIKAGQFAKFEASLAKTGTDYFCGKLPSVCDFHIWEQLDQWRILSERHGAGDVFENIPQCKAFYDRFRALPTLQKYFDSEAYQFAVNGPGWFQ